MGHQKKGPMLEPVLENYMGPPISYNSTRASTKPGRGGGTMRIARVAPASAEPSTTKHVDDHHASKGVVGKSSLRNPVTMFGKLRDRYIKAMNEVAVRGDLASVAGYHGCVVEYPDVVVVLEQRDDHHHWSSAAREKEIRCSAKKVWWITCWGSSPE